MARHQSHFALSTLLGIGYAGAGIVLFHTHPEYALLASVIVVVAGILPNIDNGPTSAPAQEFVAFLAALVPLTLVESYPSLKAGGVARIALVVLCSYLATKWLFSRLVFRFTTNRGMLHSIPAAIITFEIVYLIFWDLMWQDRLYLGTAALIGFCGHLLLDATSNFEFVGTGTKKPPVLKLRGKSWTATTAMYTTALVLGWLVAQDIYPKLKLFAGIAY